MRNFRLLDCWKLGMDIVKLTEMGRFFEIAVSSAFELETQLLAGQLVNYFDQEDVNNLLPKIQDFQRKTNSYRLKILS